MFEKHKELINHISKQVFEQEKESREFSERIGNEIQQHQTEMKERRKSFNLIRNK